MELVATVVDAYELRPPPPPVEVLPMKVQFVNTGADWSSVLTPPPSPPLATLPAMRQCSMVPDAVLNLKPPPSQVLLLFMI